ncbi:MAG TPA: CpaF family protein [bacterium]|nr:CpaF family protein [bacterium]HQI48287.1 CpaF family protein [bacterium]HQJ64903.1 CpaF family protein [bacterium]
MGLRQRLRADDGQGKSTGTSAPLPAKKETAPVHADLLSLHAYHEFKERIHRRLIEKLDLSKLDTIPAETLRTLVRDVIESLLANEGEMAFELNRERLTEEILNETFGLGPLEPLLHDPTISDILVNTSSQVYVERFGKLEVTNTRFKDDVHLLNIIERIVSKVGRRVDESSPMVDARLPDGSRVNAIIPPLAIDGPILSIRKFGLHRLNMEDLLKLHSLTPAIAELLTAAVRARLNILISGGTGSGKTTLLNILSGFIPSSERIITVEDAAELQLQQIHVVRLETRLANIEGRGAVVQRDLVRNALRMRPDRIIVGEVRGAEALDMLQAMNTGHDGSLTTLHANSARDALRRLETMVLMAGANLGDRAMREQISSAIHIIIQISRLSDGTRKVMKVAEIVGMEGDTISLQDIFLFEKMGIREDGRVVGTFRTTGIRPKFVEQIETSGIRLPDEMFEPRFEMIQEEELSA